MTYSVTTTCWANTTTTTTSRLSLCRPSKQSADPVISPQRPTGRRLLEDFQGHNRNVERHSPGAVYVDIIWNGMVELSWKLYTENGRVSVFVRGTHDLDQLAFDVAAQSVSHRTGIVLQNGWRWQWQDEGHGFAVNEKQRSPPASHALWSHDPGIGVKLGQCPYIDNRVDLDCPWCPIWTLTNPFRGSF